MSKILEGKVVSTKMQDTVVVEVVRRTAHPLYKKLIRRRKRYKADNNNFNITVGDIIKMAEIRPMSKDKYFKVTEVLITKEKPKEEKIAEKTEKTEVKIQEKKSRRSKK